MSYQSNKRNSKTLKPQHFLIIFGVNSLLSFYECHSEIIEIHLGFLKLYLQNFCIVQSNVLQHQCTFKDEFSTHLIPQTTHFLELMKIMHLYPHQSLLLNENDYHVKICIEKFCYGASPKQISMETLCRLF